MSSISSDSLFHFTPSAENLIGILKDEFIPKYGLEKLSFKKEAVPLLEHAFPMICFCDIPLSQIKNHINTYGYYGIGMSKEWGKSKGLNPVLYLRQGSIFFKNLNAMIKILVPQKELEVELKHSLLEIIRYLKPYSGPFKRNGKIIENVKFYNEREWRFAPPRSSSKKRGLISKEDFENPVTRAQRNAEIADARLSFEPSDIKYIIVKEEKEISPMIQALKEIKKKYPQHIIEILTSRIMTSEQIINDL